MGNNNKLRNQTNYKSFYKLTSIFGTIFLLTSNFDNFSNFRARNFLDHSYNSTRSALSYFFKQKIDIYCTTKERKVENRKKREVDVNLKKLPCAFTSKYKIILILCVPRLLYSNSLDSSHHFRVVGVDIRIKIDGVMAI